MNTYKWRADRHREYRGMSARKHAPACIFAPACSLHGRAGRFALGAMLAFLLPGIQDAGATLLTYKDKYVVTSSTKVTTASSTVVDDTQASKTFSLSANQTVFVVYSAHNNNGSSEGEHGKEIAINVDGTDRANTWGGAGYSGYPDGLATFWIGALGTGTHTIKGRFGGLYGLTHTIDERALLIYILDGDEFKYVDNATSATTQSSALVDDPNASQTFTPSASCKALFLYNAGNDATLGANEPKGMKIAINVSGSDYSQAQKAPNSGTYANGVFTLHYAALSAASCTVKGRFANHMGTGYPTGMKRRQLGVLLFADSTLADYVSSGAQVSTASSYPADDPQAAISRTTADSRELLVIAMGTKADGTSSSKYGEAYGIQVDSNDRVKARSSSGNNSATFANSVSTAWAETLSSGSHTVQGRLGNNSGSETAKIDSRRLAALWLSTSGGGAPANQAPTVNAGIDQTITLPATASLDGTVTDDGLPAGTVTTQWSIDSGPGTVTFGNANAIDTTASFSASGVYVLKLTANDSSFSANDTVQVTVNAAAPVNYTITASAGANGAISPAGSVSIVQGANATFAITPNSGYSIADVTVDGASVGAVATYTFNNVAAGHTIAATFGASGGAATLDRVVGQSTDDAEENADSGAVSLGSTDLELIWDGYTQVVGVRFANITIPANAVVTKAYVQFTVDEASSEATALQVYGERSLNTATFSTATRNISARPLTTSMAAWSGIPAWPTVGQAGADQRTPDLSAIVQEVVNQAGWASGNAMAFIVKGSGSGKRVAGSWDYGTTHAAAPKLHVEYQTGGAPANQAPVVDAGANQTITLPATASLNGTVTDDGLPGGTVSAQWSMESGPGIVTFGNVNAIDTTASFSASGVYALKLTANDGSLSANDTVQITVNAAAPVNYTITASAAANGAISPAGSVNVTQGANATFTITPNSGYNIAGVMVDGASVGAVATYTFNNVAASHTISATFAIKHYTITASAGANGMISPAGSVDVTHGGNQTFTITANAGYHVADVLVDGASVGAVGSYVFSNVTAGHTISASFAINAVTPRAAFKTQTIVDRYSPVISIMNLAGPVQNNLSGCAIEPSANELYVVANNPTVVQVYDLDGNYKNRQITLGGFNDTEGICLIDANTLLFGITEEELGTIVAAPIPAGATSVSKSGNTVYQSTMNSTATYGLEGVTYAADSGCFYGVKEKNPMAVGKVTMSNPATTTAPFDAEQVFAGVCTDLSDLYYDMYSGHLFILSQEGNKLMECDLSGNLLATLPLSMFSQPEGVTMSADGRSLVIVGEPNQFARFSRQRPTSQHAENSGTVEITVRLSSAASASATVYYTIAGVTAVAGEDFVAAAGTLTFAPGATEANIPVTILTDAQVEQNESLKIMLSNPVNVALGADSEYELSIVDSTVINTYAITASAGANGAILPAGSINVTHGGNQSFTITPSAGYHVADVLVDGASVGAVAGYTFNNITAGHTITASFALTQTVPAINNADGVSSVSATSATLNGNLVSDGGAATAVTIYWGAADGGTTPAAWANTVNLGTISPGAFSTQVGNLNAGGTYFYRCYAANSAGGAWASTSASFTTRLLNGPVIKFW